MGDLNIPSVHAAYVIGLAATHRRSACAVGVGRERVEDLPPPHLVALGLGQRRDVDRVVPLVADDVDLSVDDVTACR